MGEHDLNLFSRAWLKIFDKKAYKRYKEKRDGYRLSERMAEFNRKIAGLASPTKPPFSFKHSGNLGDVIYALPTIRALAQGVPCKLFLHINQPAVYAFEHPLGNVMLNEAMVRLAKPLLEAQDYIESVSIYAGEPIDYDLDLMREMPFPLDRGDIARWYAYIFGAYPDLALPTLRVEPDTSYQDCIVLARSQRYNNRHLDYRFLSSYERLVFVGVEQEYELMREQIPSLAYQRMDNFLQLARVIAGSKLFIGNQSFPFAVAEGLKARRILETYAPCPNVILHGAEGYDVYFQSHFEQLVRTLSQ